MIREGFHALRILTCRTLPPPPIRTDKRRASETATPRPKHPPRKRPWGVVPAAETVTPKRRMLRTPRHLWVSPSTVLTATTRRRWRRLGTLTALFPTTIPPPPVGPPSCARPVWPHGEPYYFTLPVSPPSLP